MTKEETIAALKECAEKLGHVPSVPEFLKFAKLSLRTLRKHFGTYTRALQACGLERQGAGYQLSMKSLCMEWAGLVRRLTSLNIAKPNRSGKSTRSLRPTRALVKARARLAAVGMTTLFKIPFEDLVAAS